jgi:hypothetical protein
MRKNLQEAFVKLERVKYWTEYAYVMAFASPFLKPSIQLPRLSRQ